MIKKVYDYIIGVLDRSFTVLITFLSEVVFMYFGVHIIMGLVYIADEGKLVEYFSKLVHADDDVIVYSLNIAITLGVYCIIYSKDMFKRLIYIFSGKTDKEV